MFAEPLISFLLIRKAKNILQKDLANIGIASYLNFLMYAIVGLFAIENIFGIQSVTTWVWHLFLLGIIYVGVTDEKYSRLRTLMFAVLPYALISFAADIIKKIDSKFYDRIDAYVNAAILFSVVWLVARLISSSRQEKALEKANEKARLEAEQRKWVTIKNEELEKVVQERTSELQMQKDEIEKTLNELKATQTQLIHSEKMASLGELTAGIAHEIQNPLNFVNNFSELNAELIGEMHEEIAKGNIEEVRALAGDIKENEEKIIFHGKRADAIVKGMLQHSRASSGVKEPADINALCDEYLRLAYHGLRAKDKSFNAAMNTEFDESLPKIAVVPQDIGRVILNLLTNAFYAVKEKDTEMKALETKTNESENYQPLVTVSTKSLPHEVQILVSDNGSGISPASLEKIFQPFFTTKPTGLGTGLGLSMSFDIITKGHNGRIEVATIYHEDDPIAPSGSTFTITLPKKINDENTGS